MLCCAESVNLCRKRLKTTLFALLPLAMNCPPTPDLSETYVSFYTVTDIYIELTLYKHNRSTEHILQYYKHITDSEHLKGSRSIHRNAFSLGPINVNDNYKH